MRLTLRTLLAFLDHTLDPTDEAALSEKVKNSTMAAGLVEQIQHSTRNRDLDAPSPDSVGPTTDANAIAEYLDSTLPQESIADIERQCLDSDAHLAEVAACHQILTIALGEPAIISPSTRRKIYGLANASYVTDGNASASELEKVTEVSTEIQPVGPEDSGVAQATTRLAIEPDLNATIAAASKVIRKNHRPNGKSESLAIAGSKSRAQLEAIGPLLSGGRPSRVVPYLVTLGLAAAFLLVFTQAIKPLFKERRTTVAEQDSQTTNDDSPSNNDLANSEQPLNVDSESKTPLDSTNGNVGANGASKNDEPLASPTVTPPVKSATTPPVAPTNQSPSPEKVTASSLDNAVTPPSAPAALLDAAELSGNIPTDLTGDPNDKLNAANDSASSGKSAVIGGIEDDGGLLLTQDPQTGQWSRMLTQMPVTIGDVIVCGPTCRSRMILDGGIELELVGPAGIRIDRLMGSPNSAANVPAASIPARLFITVDFGRVILMATKQYADMSIASPAASGRLTLPRAGATAAIAVDYQRVPGTDSLDPSNSRPLMHVVSVQDAIGWKTNNGAASLGIQSKLDLITNEFITLANGDTVAEDKLAAIPRWLNPPAESAESPDRLARQGLVEYFRDDKPLELQLRDAVGFRREDVAALAARTLLNLGMPDVYFGPTGILNRPEQRNYWQAHFLDLRDFVDRGPPSAQMVVVAAQQLEGNESSAKVWRLMAGFSEQQLARGGDEELVKMLNDPVMSIRVIATETLRQVTGTNLGYRPDYETPSRRTAILEKWKAKLTRDQIRWVNPQAASDAPTIEIPSPLGDVSIPDSSPSSAPDNSAPDNSDLNRIPGTIQP